MSLPGRSVTSSLLLALALTTLVGCDHATKYVAKAELEGQPPRVLLQSLLELRYVENRDVGFNLLGRLGLPEAARFPLLVGFGAVALLLLSVFLLRKRHERLFEVALVLVLAGGLGNYIDRVARGYVIDFVHAAHWPVFNVADIWVTAGGLLLLWRTFRTGAAPPAPALPQA